MGKTLLKPDPAGNDEGARPSEQGLLEAVIADAVMVMLGRPAEFLRADVRHLWGYRYRVNVFVGPHATNARVAHSFFVTTDGNGKVLAAVPPLARAYHSAPIV